MDVQADLSDLGLGPAVRMVSALRGLNADCASVEVFAQRVCAFLHERLVGPDGQQQTALVRFYATAPLAGLPADEVAYVQDRVGGGLAGGTTCLALLGTAGAVEDWNHRTRSVGHRVLPLLDVAQVTAMPMVSALLVQLGVDVNALVRAEPEVGAADGNGSARVFHVPEATGSRLVPDQDFVARHGVRSAFGFGGALPTGEVYAVVVFSTVAVPLESAELFGAMALSTSVAALDMLDLPLFTGQGRGERTFAVELGEAERAQASERLVRELLDVHERLAASEADKAEAALQQARYDADRAAALAAVALRMTSVRTVAEVTAVIVNDALPVLRADGGAVALVDETGEAVNVAISGTYGAASQRFARLPLDDSLPLVWSARRDEIVLVPDVEDALTRFAGLARVQRELGVQAVASFPLVVDGRLLGSLTLTWATRQVFADAALELMRALAAQTAQALDRARLVERERRHSAALQRSFLTRPPSPAGLEVTARYRPAAQYAQVGGDWHDAFPAGDGSTVLAVGDVVGHDMLAAAAMGQLRTLLRGIAFTRPGRPATTLDLLEATVASLELETIATVVLARLETVEEGPHAGWQRVTWSNAGHPPPLLLAEGTASVLATEPDLMIGVEAGRPHTQHELLLAPGSALVLYTDGLIERRDEDIEVGVERLRALVSSLDHLDLDALCDELLTRMLPEQGAEDDVALLVVRLPGANDVGTGRTERSTTLEPEALSAQTARQMVCELLRDTGKERWRDAAELAVSEVVTNAVLHAHSPIRLLAAVDERQIRVEVRDDNPSMPTARHYDATATTGRGMALLAAVADSHGVSSLGRLGKVVWFTVGDRRGAAQQGPEPGRPDRPESADDRQQRSAEADGEPIDTVPVMLRGLPTALWLATRQAHDALLRELALHRAGRSTPDVAAGPAHAARGGDLAAADRARARFASALDLALGGGPTGAPLPLPATVDLVLPLTPDQASSFGHLQDALDEGERLAAADRLLVRPSLPEVTAVRDWACEQVISQLSGAAPVAWGGIGPVHTAAGPVPATTAEEVAHVRDAVTGAVAADDANRIVAVSRPLADALGWAPEDLLGRRVVALVPVRLREAHVAGFTRHLATGEAHILGVGLDLPVLRRDGTELMCRMRIEASNRADGRVLYTAWITPLPA